MTGPLPGGDAGYAEVAIRFASAGGRVEARLETPAGDSEWQPVALPLAGHEAEELAHRALLDARLSGRGDEPARRLGRALFAALLHGPALERYRAAQGPARTAAPPLRLRFHLGAGSEAERALHRLPWELLCEPGPGGGRLLALDRRLSVVRHLTIGDGVPPMARPPRLRVLVAAAEGRAPGAPPLDLGGEIAAIRAACPPGGDVAVEVLRPAPLEALIERLRGGGFHVLHLIGHGELGGGDGVVLLPDADGRLVACPGEQLAQQIGGLSPLRLVVLNACRTAESVAERPFAGVATALLAHGLPAAVAMQAPITDGAAARFAAVLFARLAAGAGLDAAVAEGRLAIGRERPRTFEWAVPVLFSRLPGGELFAPAETGEGRRHGRERGGRPRAPRRGRWSARRRRAAGAIATAVLAGSAFTRRSVAEAITAVLAGVLVVALALLGLAAVIGGGDRGDARDESAPGTEEGSQGAAGAAAPSPAAATGTEALGPRRGEEGDAEDGSANEVERSAAPADLAGVLGPAAPPPAKVSPPDGAAGEARSDGSGQRLERPAEPSAASSGEPAGAAPFCIRQQVLHDGEAAELPELGSRLAVRILDQPGLGPYVTFSLLGRYVGQGTAAGPRNLDFRPGAPLVVSVLGIDAANGSVRLSCRVVANPP
ncbi:MAG TPA: CHAT domain-containing protein [Thermoanaerobaculia bacterium]